MKRKDWRLNESSQTLKIKTISNTQSLDVSTTEEALTGEWWTSLHNLKYASFWSRIIPELQKSESRWADPTFFSRNLSSSGRKGVAINFITDEDKRTLHDIEKFYNTRIDEMPMNVADLI